MQKLLFQTSGITKNYRGKKYMDKNGDVDLYDLATLLGYYGIGP